LFLAVQYLSRLWLLLVVVVAVRGAVLVEELVEWRTSRRM
jgi:hypothetical protein